MTRRKLKNFETVDQALSLNSKTVVLSLVIFFVAIFLIGFSIREWSLVHLFAGVFLLVLTAFTLMKRESIALDPVNQELCLCSDYVLFISSKSYCYADYLKLAVKYSGSTLEESNSSKKGITIAYHMDSVRSYELVLMKDKDQSVFIKEFVNDSKGAMALMRTIASKTGLEYEASILFH